MILIEVAVRLPDGTESPAGQLAVAGPDARGALRGEFRYLDRWLDHPQRFPLDPLHLPLERGPKPARNPRTGVHGVFEDALPDDWGRRLLIARHRIPRHEQRVPFLLRALAGDGLGALTFGGHGIAEASLADLEQLLEAAARVEAGLLDEIDRPMQLLLDAGSSPGGARPKAVLRADGIQYIAKFPSRRDELELVRIEAASLDLAEAAGLETPARRLVELPGGRAALLVERFDVTAAGGRRHVVSAQTLMGFEESYYFTGYAELADVVRRVTDRPLVDPEQLFRWAAVNGLLGNTDDHLKNVAMLHDADGWRLAPAFDILPDVAGRREHVLSWNGSAFFPGFSALAGLGAAFGLSRGRAERVAAQVRECIAGWEAAFRARGVPEDEIARLRPDIARRIAV